VILRKFLATLEGLPKVEVSKGKLRMTEAKTRLRRKAKAYLVKMNLGRSLSKGVDYLYSWVYFFDHRTNFFLTTKKI